MKYSIFHLLKMKLFHLKKQKYLQDVNGNSLLKQKSENVYCKNLKKMIVDNNNQDVQKICIEKIDAPHSMENTALIQPDMGMNDVITSSDNTSTSTNESSSDQQKTAFGFANGSTKNYNHKRSLNTSAGKTSKFSKSARNNAKFHKIFNLPLDEALIKTFPCALVAEILFQGTFYSSARHFCFHSRLATAKRKAIKIHLSDVLNVTREKTAGIFPNAIAIHAKGQRYVFGSIISRDNVYKHLVTIWENYKLFYNNQEAEDDKTDVINILAMKNDLSPELVEMPTLLVTSEENNIELEPNADLYSSEEDVEDEDEVEDEGDDNEFIVENKSTPISSANLFTKTIHKASSTFCRMGSSHLNIPKLRLDGYQENCVLFLALIILLGCVAIACLLAWKVHVMQLSLNSRIDQLLSLTGHTRFEEMCESEESLFLLRQITHRSQIERIQKVFEVNLQTLDQLQNNLKANLKRMNMFFNTETKNLVQWPFSKTPT